MKDSKLKEEVQAAVREYLRVSLYIKTCCFVQEEQKKMKDSKLKAEVQAVVREYLRVRVSLYVKTCCFV